ncbi:hypothetical protein [Micromonospora sp. DT47]|uniref:VG15 protein n=1 Tax=Micromonospora sp. DT47 TaxID=3393431 RepID=UPI003CEA853C
MDRLASLLWRRVDRANIADSWAGLVPSLLGPLLGAQRSAAASADAYLSAVLAEQRLSPVAVGRVNVDALVGVASDGRELQVLLNQPSLTALTALSRGYTLDRAMASGEAAVRMIAATQVADAGRAADEVAMTAHREATGYVRMLSLPACARCVILAGKWYEFNAGFLRHPKCDCVHVPGSEDTAEDLRTNPQNYFDSLTAEEQDRIFTKAGAESIRLGANMNQIVNARRGAAGLTPAGARITGPEARILRGGRSRGRLQAQDVYGRELLVTSEGVTVRGVAGIRLGARQTGSRRAGDRYRSAKTPRLMPESILQIAGDDREEALRLLQRFGYIL